MTTLCFELCPGWCHIAVVEFKQLFVVIIVVFRIYSTINFLLNDNNAIDRILW